MKENKIIEENSTVKLQVLVATMKQKDLSKVEEMNIRTDAIFANQFDEHSYIEKEYPFGIVKMITTDTHGVGTNRNIALLYSDADYILFSDDDVYYVDDYREIVMEAFDKIPDADAIIFNVKAKYGNATVKDNVQIKRVRFYNAMSYGAIRIAVKRTSIKKENIMFNLNFGGGTVFSAGEDTMFIMDMIRCGLKIYTYPKCIAAFDDTEEKSSWFTGYNQKYYYDKGAFFGALCGKGAKVLCIQELIRHPYYKQSGMKFSQVYSLMKKGIQGYNNLEKYNK